jgi:hypothetical protein
MLTEIVGKFVREGMSEVTEVRFEIGRRNLDPEGSLAHLALAEVAEQ